MAYTKTTWTNGTTALSADNMNHIETGIKDAHDAISDINTDLADVYDKEETDALTGIYIIPATTSKAVSGNAATAISQELSPPEGYTPVGIVGVQLGNTSVYLYGFRVIYNSTTSKWNAEVDVKNPVSNQQNVPVVANVLYVKTETILED